METDFIYWRHITPVGIKVEEVSGREDKSGAVWLAMARQIYCENGRDGAYRSVLHLASGAPLLDGEETRISISHTEGLLAVASLPKTPEADLATFSPRTAMGIDVERRDRMQVMKVRERFLSPEEMELVGDSCERNIIAWTAKEALYKASFEKELDWRKNYRIISLPEPGVPTMLKGAEAPAVGRAELIRADGTVFPMELYSYYSDDFCITIAYSPKCAKYKRG